MLLFSKSLFCVARLYPALKLLAYIDPSTGSLVFQAIAASIISAGLFISAVRDRIVWLITAAWRKKTPADQASIGGSNPVECDQQDEVWQQML